MGEPVRASRRPQTFEALGDPIDIARVHAAVEVAWRDLRSRSFEPSDSERDRHRLRDIVASHVLLAANDHDLVRRSIDGFLAQRRRP